MQINNYFNLKRFSRLLKQDLLINKTKYLLTLIGLGLITYLFLYWFLSINKVNMSENEYAIHQTYISCFMFYMLAVGVVIGTAFPELSDKIKASNYLLSPASTFEKVTLQFLLRIILFVPIALGIFWIAVRLAKASLSPEMVNFNLGKQLIDPTKIPYFEFHFLITRSANVIFETSAIIIMIFGLFSYGMYLFAGATYFKRYALIKTVIASIVLFVISILFTVLLSHIFYPQETHGFSTQPHPFYVTKNLESGELFIVMLSILSWVFFLPFAYFKLKEKEA